MANEGNLKPFRSASEAREKGKAGGVKSGESRRKKKIEKDRLKMLLELTPNMDIFLESGANRKNFDMLGIEKDTISDVETLTDLKLLQSALMGDLSAKKYIDERMGKSPALELKQQEHELKRREAELKEKTFLQEEANLNKGKLDQVLEALENVRKTVE